MKATDLIFFLDLKGKKKREFDVEGICPMYIGDGYKIGRIYLFIFFFCESGDIENLRCALLIQEAF